MTRPIATRPSSFPPARSETTDARRRSGLALLLLGLLTGLLLAAGTGRAFTLLFGKWDDPTPGTPAVVTWGFILPGAGIDPSAPVAWTGPNRLGSGDPVLDPRTRIDAIHGAGAFDAALERAFATWSAATNLSFVRLPDSAGGFASVTSPDIRIGAYAFGDPAAGAAFGPPGNDLLFPDALAGDLALDHEDLFTIAVGSEGDAIPRLAGAIQNDLESLMLHELGHALGLGHSDVVDGVMCGFIPGDAFDPSSCVGEVIRRTLRPDDLAGIRALYGEPAPPVPGLPVAGGWMLGAAAIGLTVRFAGRARHAVLKTAAGTGRQT